MSLTNTLNTHKRTHKSNETTKIRKYNLKYQPPVQTLIVRYRKVLFRLYIRKKKLKIHVSYQN